MRAARRRLGSRWRSTSGRLLALPAQHHRPALPADRPARPAGPGRGRQPGRPGATTAWRRSTSAAAVAGVRAALGDDPADVLAAVDGAIGPPTLDALVRADHRRRLHPAPRRLPRPVPARTTASRPLPGRRPTATVDRRHRDRLAGAAGQAARGPGPAPPRLPGACESADAGGRGGARRAGPAAGARAGDAGGGGDDRPGHGRDGRGAGRGASTAGCASTASWTGRWSRPRRAGRAARHHGPVRRSSAAWAGGRSSATPRPATDAARSPTASTAWRPLLASGRRCSWPAFAGARGDPARACSGPTPQQLSRGRPRRARTRRWRRSTTLCQEALELTLRGAGAGPGSAGLRRPPPFRGPVPVPGRGSAFFFGREALVERLRERLARAPLPGGARPVRQRQVVAGPGRAGPRRCQVASRAWSAVVLTPGGDPLADAARRPGRVGGRAGGAWSSTSSRRSSPSAPTRPRGTRSSTGCWRWPARGAVVLTMRADFWGECAAVPGAARRMQAHQELVAPMDAAELRAAMEQQAAAVGLRFEAGLAGTILDDVRGRAGGDAAVAARAAGALEAAARALAAGRGVPGDRRRAGGDRRHGRGRLRRAERPDQERVRDIFVRLTRLDEDAAPGRGAARHAPAGGAGGPGAGRAATGGDQGAGRAPGRRPAGGDRRRAARSGDRGGGRARGADPPLAAAAGLARRGPGRLRLRQEIGEAAQEWEGGGPGRRISCYTRAHACRRRSGSAATRGSGLNALERPYLDACVKLRESEQVERDRHVETSSPRRWTRRLVLWADSRRSMGSPEHNAANHRGRCWPAWPWTGAQPIASKER